MIYTVTFNPSIDYYVKVEDFKLGEVNRCKSNYKYPGGKGINVSRVLKKLGSSSVALGFVGGFTGEYISQCLNNEGINIDFIKINEDTRINVKIKGNEETEINGEGPKITKEQLDELLKKIDKLTSEDFLVLAGNVQNSVDRSIYADIQERCLKNNVKVIVDTTGEALKLTLKNRPLLIKPNNHELGEIFNIDIKTEDEIIKYAEELLKLGAQNVIVSMGKKGARLVSKDGVYSSSAPKGELINSVGAGDSLIAGFISEYSRNFNIIEAFRVGIASGSATAFSQDLCTKEKVEELLETIIVNKVK
ncbi:1-phosphofructokinase [Clostridium brassicae]|uniref:Tagatose-6-phosphate kinase n=1 Tax=Clostridium brassicae TaxID=2999072 RepID=A0ABT4D4U3_9CLOT|nr:1-phosphofructokinase [Clostridium brassicae]MCY6957297.1 1-phosphofructokinase [Clostridium brassicae]